MNHMRSFLPHFMATLVVGILALIGGFYLAAENSVQAAYLTQSSTASPGAVPGAINYQGVVRDADGNLLSSDLYTMTFRIYSDAAGLSGVLWDEAHEGVAVRDGRFSTTLGFSEPITPSLMSEGGDMFVGVTVDGFPEMQPKLRFSSVPYAMHAYNGVPKDGIMHFIALECPIGWEEYLAARGRYLVSVAEGDPPNVRVGNSLSLLENRTVGQHNHAVTDPGHNHSIFDPGHSHSIFDPGHSHNAELHNDDGSDEVFFEQSEQGSDPQDKLTDSSQTGISINSASTGISVNSNLTNISVDAEGSVAGTNAPYVTALACVKL